MLYFYPNRPLLLTPDHPNVKKMSKDKNWIAEVKFNGDRLCLHYENGQYIFWNRQHEIFKRYIPPQSLIAELNSLQLPSGTHLDGELLHFHTKQIKHKIIFYDIYFHDGKKQMGPLAERRKLLEKIFCGTHRHLALTEQFKNDFANMFNRVIAEDECEGLVMKDLRGTIVWNSVKSPDVSWQMKIRRPTKNYKF